MGSVLSVNVGAIAPFRAGRARTSAIVKTPAGGAVAVDELGLRGDEHADPAVHGGRDQAVYAYARESYHWWERELGRSLASATLGENLTTSGIDVDCALIGERWEIGSLLLEVTSPRIPCAKLGARMGDPAFVKRFRSARRPGAYLRVLRGGSVRAGDAIEIVSRPEHGVTIATVFEAKLFDVGLAARLLEAPALAPRVRDWARERVAAA